MDDVADNGLIVSAGPDFDDVKTTGLIPQPELFQIARSDTGNFLTLPPFNGLTGPAVALRSSRLDFDENKRPSMVGNDIDFTHAIAVVAAADAIIRLMPYIIHGSLFSIIA